MINFSKEFKIITSLVFIAFFSLVLIKGDLNFFREKAVSNNGAAYHQPKNVPPSDLPKDEAENNGKPIVADAPNKEVASNKPQVENKKAEDKKVPADVAGVKEVPEERAFDDAKEEIEEVREPQREMYPVTLYVQGEKYETQVLPGASAYDLMLSLQNQARLKFSGENHSGLGFFLKEINGIKNNPKTGEFWIYYINGKSASIGVSVYNLKPGDIISWKYTKETQ